MLKLENILAGITDRAWQGVGYPLERSTQASAVVNAIMLQELNDGTRHEDLSEEKDTGQFAQVPRAEKFQRACYILAWMENLPSDYLYYEKAHQMVARRRPTLHDSTEFLRTIKAISKIEQQQLADAYGVKYAERLVAEELAISNDRWEKYGDSAMQMVRDEVESQTDRPIDLAEKDWNMSDFAYWVATKLQPAINFKCDPDNEFSLPSKFGFRTPWVREAVGDMLMILPDNWQEVDVLA
jgi:hypothetical protein|tara:strand:+ start:118 stop:837 length:720 start_codon:yes stop_codon:yes gene_type:complete